MTLLDHKVIISRDFVVFPVSRHFPYSKVSKGGRSSWATQLRPQSGADLGQSEEGRRPEQAPGESAIEAGPIQD